MREALQFSSPFSVPQNTSPHVEGILFIFFLEQYPGMFKVCASCPPSTAQVSCLRFHLSQRYMSLMQEPPQSICAGDIWGTISSQSMSWLVEAAVAFCSTWSHECSFWFAGMLDLLSWTLLFPHRYYNAHVVVKILFLWKNKNGNSCHLIDIILFCTLY